MGCKTSRFVSESAVLEHDAHGYEQHAQGTKPEEARQTYIDRQDRQLEGGGEQQVFVGDWQLLRTNRPGETGRLSSRREPYDLSH